MLHRPSGQGANERVHGAAPAIATPARAASARVDLARCRRRRRRRGLTPPASRGRLPTAPSTPSPSRSPSTRTRGSPRSTGPGVARQRADGRWSGSHLGVGDGARRARRARGAVDGAARPRSGRVSCASVRRGNNTYDEDEEDAGAVLHLRLAHRRLRHLVLGVLLMRAPAGARGQQPRGGLEDGGAGGPGRAAGRGARVRPDDGGRTIPTATQKMKHTAHVHIGVRLRPRKDVSTNSSFLVKPMSPTTGR